MGQNLYSVIMLQRCGINLSRTYHIVLRSDENIKCLQKFGVICGHEVNHDLNAARFKTSILAYCDSTHNGGKCMAAISNCDISEVHIMHLEITMANMPCDNSNCAIKSIYNFFYDKCGSSLDHAHCKMVLHSNQ